MRKIGLVIVSILAAGMLGTAYAQSDSSLNSNKFSEGYYFESPNETDVEENDLKRRDTMGTFKHQTQPIRNESVNDNYKEYEFDSEDEPVNQNSNTESDHGGYQKNGQEHHNKMKN